MMTLQDMLSNIFWEVIVLRAPLTMIDVIAMLILQVVSQVFVCLVTFIANWTSFWPQIKWNGWHSTYDNSIWLFFVHIQKGVPRYLTSAEFPQWLNIISDPTRVNAYIISGQTSYLNVRFASAKWKLATTTLPEGHPFPESHFRFSFHARRSR